MLKLRSVPTLREQATSASRIVAAMVASLFASPIGNLHADSDAALDAARARLVGPSSRTWIKDRVVVSMGASPSCEAGETYRFQASGTLTITRCIDHTLRKEDTPWSLERTGPVDVTLHFSGRGYQLTFSNVGRKAQMRWSYMHGSKIDPTEDTFLSLSKD